MFRNDDGAMASFMYELESHCPFRSAVPITTSLSLFDAADADSPIPIALVLM